MLPDPNPALERARTLEAACAWDEAADAYSVAFHESLRAGRTATAVEALRRGAAARERLGRADEAEELVGLSFTLAELWGMERAAARALNVHGNLCFAQSDFARAEALYRAALERARGLRDDELVGLACQNLGVVANIHGELADARSCYLESIASCIRSGDRAAAMMVYNNLGMLCADLHEWLESDLYFDRGIEIARRLGDRRALAHLHANNAEPLIHMGEAARAAAALDAAEEVAAPLGDAATLALAARFRSVLARMAGDFDTADGHLRQAATLAEADGLELERAEILGGLARLRWAQGRRDEARTAVLEARARFAVLGAAREIRRLDAVIAEWGT